MTDLDSLQVGCLVWSTKHLAAGEGSESTRGGIVVDVGMYEDTGKPFVVYLQELSYQEVRVHVYWRGAKKAKPYNVARLARMDLDEVNAEAIEPPSATRMEAWARKAMLGAVLLPWGKDNHLALIGAAGVLLDAGKALTADLRAETQSRVDEFNAERAEREGLAS